MKKLSATASVMALLVILLLVFTSGYWFASRIPDEQIQGDRIHGDRIHGDRVHAEQSSAPASSPQAPEPQSVTTSSGGPTGLSALADPLSLELFSQLLRDYQTENIDQEEKILIEQTLRELNSSRTGRSFIVDAFFSSDEPDLTASMYNLMLDADLKDLSLIVELIERDQTEDHPASKSRIVDLIADLSAQGEAPYAAAVDDFLAQMAQQPDPVLRTAAKSQRAWYVAHHRPEQGEVLREYLLDDSAKIRNELYDLIEIWAPARAPSERLETALTLKSLLHADYLGVTAQEEERIRLLVEKLEGDGGDGRDGLK